MLPTRFGFLAFCVLLPGVLVFPARGILHHTRNPGIWTGGPHNSAALLRSESGSDVAQSRGKQPSTAPGTVALAEEGDQTQGDHSNKLTVSNERKNPGGSGLFHHFCGFTQSSGGVDHVIDN